MAVQSIESKNESINISVIADKIADLIKYICDNPLIHFSEHDLHVLLMAKLFEIDDLNPFKSLHEITELKDTNNKSIRNDKDELFKTMLVHREYGLGEKRRGDIFIFNKDTIVGFNPFNELKRPKSQKEFYITPDYIIEMGTEKSCRATKAYKNHFEKDIEKIMSVVKKEEKEVKGIFIHMHRNFIKSQGGKLQGNNIKKIDDFKDITKKLIKEKEELIKKNNINIDIRFLVLFINYYAPYEKSKNKYSSEKCNQKYNLSLFDPADKSFLDITRLDGEGVKGIKDKVKEILMGEK